MEKLTQQEEEAMLVIWQFGRGYTKDFLNLLSDNPPYTTFASTIKNLKRKGFLTSEKVGNSIRYAPAIAEKEYKNKFMNGFVNDYFQNSYKELVTFFADEKKISAADLEEIVKLVKKRKS